MSNTKTKSLNMIEGPWLKKLIAFAIPIIFTGVLQQLYNAADMMVVGMFSKDSQTALAAVGSTGSLTNLVIGLFMGLSVGAGVCVAHHVGEGKQEEVSKVLHTSVLMSLSLGVVIFGFGYFAAPSLLRLMGTPEGPVLENAILYIRIIFAGFPASLVYNYCAAMLRSAGDAKHPLIFLSVSGLVNVLLNVVLVAGFHFDVAGVAIATIASQYLSAIMVIVYLARSKGFLHFSVRRLAIHKDKIKKVLYIGIPSGIQSCLFAFSNVLIQSSINSFGDVVMAGSATATNLENFVYIAMNSFYHVSLTFVGQNMGAKRYHNIKKITLYCVASAAVLGIFLSTVIMVFHEPLINLFAPNNPAVMEATMVKLWYVCCPYFMCGVMEVLCGTMRAMGRSVTSMVISLCGACGVRVLWVMTIFKLFPSPACVYLSYPVTWMLTIVAYSVLLVIFVRRLHKQSKTTELLP